MTIHRANWRLDHWRFPLSRCDEPDTSCSILNRHSSMSQYSNAANRQLNDAIVKSAIANESSVVNPQSSLDATHSVTAAASA
jgi:hypothetical protein